MGSESIIELYDIGTDTVIDASYELSNQALAAINPLINVAVGVNVVVAVTVAVVVAVAIGIWVI